jgi:hypothetical protein
VEKVIISVVAVRSCLASSTLGMIICLLEVAWCRTALVAKLGCAALLRAAIHVLVGGWIAMLIAYGLMCLLSFDSHF